MSETIIEANTITREAVRGIAESRRSVRQFLAEEVPESDIQEILRLTGLAPSASNVQTWRWAVVRSPDMIERLAEAMSGANVQTARNAPASIVLYSDGPEVLVTLEDIMHPGLGSEEITKRAGGMRERLSGMGEEKLKEWARTQTYIALGQFVLIARGMGYDTVTMGGFKEAEVKEVLGLPGSVAVTSVIGLGRRQQDGFSHHRHPVERISRWY